MHRVEYDVTQQGEHVRSSPTPGWIFLETIPIWSWIPLYTAFFPDKFSVPNSLLLLLIQLKHSGKPCSLSYADLSTFSPSLCWNLHFAEERPPGWHCKLCVLTPRAFFHHSLVHSLHRHHKHHVSHSSFYLGIFKLSCSSPFSINTDTKNWDQHLRQH